MAELFRYIEQAFVAGSRPSHPIDVTSNSDFQNELRAEPGAVRQIAETFLNDRLSGADGSGLPDPARYLEFRKRLLALPSPAESGIRQLVEETFDDDAEGVTGADAFLADKKALDDILVAIKLTTGFDKANAAGLVAMRQAMAFLEDLATGERTDFSREALRAELSRPINIPQVYLPAAAAETPPTSPPPRAPDPAASRREELLREQSAFESAYEKLMGLHPTQLQIRSVPERPAPAAAISSLIEGEHPSIRDSSAASTREVLSLPRAILSALAPTVQKTIEAELPDAQNAPIANIVDVVKRKWLDVSEQVEPYKLPSPAKIYRVGMHVFAVQQPQAMQVQAAEPPPLPDFSHAVTRPVGIGNLQLVRQELVGYEAGDISHIENVLPGELMRRVTRREETNELTVTEETDTSQTQERDLQSTERNELASEAQKEAGKQTVSTQDQTTTTSYGRLVENSKTNYARSVTDRAVNTLTQMVKQQRIQREKKVFTDKAVHEFDNRQGADGIRGIYQWLDKKYKTRILNYGKRLLYDVVIPEPAAFLIDTLKTAAQPENFQLVRPTEPFIYPSNLNASNYMYWAARYGVTGSVTPPPDEFSVTFAHPESPQDYIKQIQAYGGTFTGNYFNAFVIRIPENYRAIGGYVQRTNPKGANLNMDRLLELYVGEYYFVRFRLPDNLNHSFTMNGETGEIPVTVRSFDPIIQFNFAIGINCQRTDKALEQWQLKTHATIMQGYQRQRAEYTDQLSRYQAAVRAQMALAHNFAHDSTVEREELKKAFLHLLMSEHFGQVFYPAPPPDQLPADPLYVKKWGAVVAFFERAFEWENIMYIYYPYFWGRLARWGELILIQDTDPEFQAFLRAGAARVVVPARPGFEAALAHYHETGDVWMGEEIPDMFSELYVSIIAEIKARNFKQGDEICIGEWDVKLPTTLVMLKQDSTLPEWQPAKDCIPPPEQ